MQLLPEPLRQPAVQLASRACVSVLQAKPPGRFALYGLSPRSLPAGRSVEIIDVWEGSIDEEMTKLRKLVERFPFVAMVRSPLAQVCCGERVPSCPLAFRAPL